MAKSRNKTEAQIVIFSTRPPLYYGLGIFLGIFLSTVLISIFYFCRVEVTAEIAIWIGMLFLLMVAGAWLIRLEFRFYVKNDFEKRPPFQFLFYLLISIGLLYYLQIVHDPFRKLNIGILPYLTAPVFGIVFAWIAKTAVFTLYISILHIFDRLRQHTVLLYKDFLEEMNQRINNFKRYKNYFSLIILGIWVNDKYKERLQKKLEYPLIFEIVRRNIRRGDIIGISNSGNRVLVLSNHNAQENASKHADRIINVLNHDPVLQQMVETASPEYLFVIEEGSEESAAAANFVKKTEKKLDTVFSQRDVQWREESAQKK